MKTHTILTTLRSFAITVLPMPKLSPTPSTSLIGTKLLKWHVEENMLLDTYALVCDVETNVLTDDTSKEVFQMEVEIQENCYIAKLLYNEGDLIKAGLPIAICCDDEDELEEAQSNDVIDLQLDAYKQAQFCMAGFQSYTKRKVT